MSYNLTCMCSVVVLFTILCPILVLQGFP
uniref:Uncharacterized protein n=1 Tax=Arundo donax TaxID=35708 RepID=A0A0A8Z9K9_ARUDO